MGERRRLAELELRALQTIRKFAMLQPGDGVVVAVSGGADSMALLLCLHGLAPLLGLKLTVAHLNHRLRGADADADEEFARQAAASLGLPFSSEAVDVKARSASAGQNLEEAARGARYEFLSRIAAESASAKIATGHNLDDQAETVLLRMLRGSGPGGFEGIRPVRGGRVVRPLIECARAQILEFLASRGAAYREDATNRDLSFQRNRIRHELIPYLSEHFNPRVAATLAREAGLARAAFDFVAAQARSEFERLRSGSAGEISLAVAPLIELHPAVRQETLRCALLETLGSLRGVDAVHIESMLRLCRPGQSGRRVKLPGGAGARRTLDRIELLRKFPKEQPGFEYALGWPGKCIIPETGMEIVASLLEIPGQPADPLNAADLDAGALPPVLTIRSRLPGDRYGGPGHRKLKKMLLNARVHASDRGALPLVAAGHIVIWAPGFAPAKNYRAQSDCRRCVRVTLNRTTGS